MMIFGAAEAPMPAPYSLDLRERVVALLEEGRQPLEVARLTNLGVATVGRWKRAFRERGNVEPLPAAGGPAGKLGVDGHEFLLTYVSQHVDATLAEMQDALFAHLSIDVCDATISAMLVEHGYSWKKKTFRLREADAEALLEMQKSFMEVASTTPPEKMVFLDECGANEAMTPTRARSLQGERAYAPRVTRRGEKGVDHRRSHA